MEVVGSNPTAPTIFSPSIRNLNWRYLGFIKEQSKQIESLIAARNPFADERLFQDIQDPQWTKALRDSSRRAGRRLGKELDLALKLARPILPVCPLAYKMS